jgi:Phage-related protein
MFNPLDQWVGLSPLRAAALAVDIHNAGMRFNKALLDNSARPSGAIKLTGIPDEMALSRLREEVKIFRQGPSNAGSVPLLYGGSDWVELGLSPKDMDFKESMSMSAVSIAAAYGVPFPLIVPDAATFANMRDAREAMWENTVLPMLDKVIGGLSRWLLPVFALENARLCYSADGVTALEGKRQRKFDRIIAAKNAGIVTINEARQELDMGPVDGGDLLLVPSSQVPLDMAGLGFDAAAPTTDATAVKKAISLVGYRDEAAKEQARNGFGLHA